MVMTNIDWDSAHQRMDSCVGIAIGPILFIIAVLGVLAMAIAAGGGSFTTSTTVESNRAKASAVIDIGQNLKIGFERLLGNGVPFNSIDLNPEHTTAADDLFSPTGGGITPPSTAMAEAPADEFLPDVWSYPLIAVPGLGTAAGSQLAVLRVSEGVCDKINALLHAMAPGVAHGEAANIADFAMPFLNNGSAWPPSFSGKMTGCVENTNGETLYSGFYFYQILGVR